MRNTPRFTSIGARLMIAAAIPAMLVAATPASAREIPMFVDAPNGIGSAHPGFRRHFWRGQFNHGPSALQDNTVYDPDLNRSRDADG